MSNQFTRQGRQSEKTLIEFLQEQGVFDPHINEPCNYTSDKCPKLRRLAAPYAQHPDYRKKWLP